MKKNFWPLQENVISSNERKKLSKFILNTNQKKHILKPGDFLAVNSKQLHSEKTYSQGATILLGKRFKN